MTQGKYGTITSSEKQFHLNEPIFLLRATDPLAPQAISKYADLCSQEGCSDEHVRAAYDWAATIAAWQSENPELVKALPD